MPRTLQARIYKEYAKHDIHSSAVHQSQRIARPLIPFDALMPLTTICYDSGMFASLIKLVTRLKKRVFRTGKSSKESAKGPMANQALPKTKPFKTKPVSMGGPRPGIDLVKANQLAGELEDEEIIRKMRLGK